jgi:hypothetical protein
MVRARLQKMEFMSARRADEDRLDRRLHVVVDASPADPAIVPGHLLVGSNSGSWVCRQARERYRLVAPLKLEAPLDRKLIGT